MRDSTRCSFNAHSDPLSRPHVYERRGTRVAHAVALDELKVGEGEGGGGIRWFVNEIKHSPGANSPMSDAECQAPCHPTLRRGGGVISFVTHAVGIEREIASSVKLERGKRIRIIVIKLYEKLRKIIRGTRSF